MQPKLAVHSNLLSSVCATDQYRFPPTKILLSICDLSTQTDTITSPDVIQNLYTLTTRNLLRTYYICILRHLQEALNAHLDNASHTSRSQALEIADQERAIQAVATRLTEAVVGSKLSLCWCVFNTFLQDMLKNVSG